MAQGDSNYEASEIAADWNSCLVSPALLTRLLQRAEVVKSQLCELEIIGTAEEISAAIGNHHLLRGRLLAIYEIVDEHKEALEAMAQVKATQS